MLFKAVSPQDVNKGVIEDRHLGQPVRVTDRERTFVDCLDRVSYAGGWEECLKSLESVRGLNFDRMVDYLLSRENGFLVRKVGLVLEHLKDSSAFYSHLTENRLEDLSERTGGSPRYLEGVREAGGKSVLNERWNLYVHPRFGERFLRGV